MDIFLLVMNGRIFFVDRYWYTPTSKDVTLNSVEEYNVSMILKEEATR